MQLTSLRLWSLNLSCDSVTCYMMASVDLPFPPLTISIVFIILYAVLSVKLMKSSFPSIKIWVSRSGTRDEQQLMKRTSSSAVPLSQPTAQVIEKESIFSADWWCHDNIFQLERRAIFSKVPSTNFSDVASADIAAELDLRYTSLPTQ